MSIVSDLVAAIQGLAVAVGATAIDPSDRVRLLAALAMMEPIPGGSVVMEALCRRSALSELARAASEVDPRSYEEARTLRDMVCDLLDQEELRAADAREDAIAKALRDLRGAVYRDLTRRGASLSPTRDFAFDATLPAVVLAHRIYGDATREAELTRMAGDPPNPLRMPGRFRALAR